MLFGGCDRASDAAKDPGTTLRIRAELPGASDVVSVSFAAQPVDCTSGAVTGAAIVQIVPLEDQSLPGNTGLANNPLDKGSAHSFADLFAVVPAGCYNVVTTPLQADGSPSKICAVAFKNQVVVLAGKTTEIFLINQCTGTDPGAIDLISALNHAPTLDNVKFADSKFACGQPARICVVGHDIDGDPLQFTLAAEGCDVSPTGEPQGAPTTGVTQCFAINCHSVGEHNLVATVYDLIWRDGQLIRIEDWLMQEGYPNPSHGQLTFHTYVDGVKYYPDQDGDGHGDPNGTVQIVCQDTKPPAGYVISNDDCNDNDPKAYPGAAEICADGVDNNCNGQVDEEEACPTPTTQCKVGYTCGTYQIGDCQCGEGSTCGQTAEGVPQCMARWYCDTHQDCVTSADCPSGALCFVNTCCGVGKCAAPPDYCPAPPAAAPKAASSPASAPQGATSTGK
jgi:hypothetical protein